MSLNAKGRTVSSSSTKPRGWGKPGATTTTVTRSAIPGSRSVRVTQVRGYKQGYSVTTAKVRAPGK